MNQHNPQSGSFRFTTRSLVLLTVLCAIAVAICVFLYISIRQEAGYGPYATVDKWPRALVQMIGDNEKLRQDVEPYGLGQFIDHRSVWRIKAGSPLRDVLFEKNELQPADVRHPKSSELRRSLPSGWGKYHWDRCTWHATPGYGSKHIEGVDLYLIADDPLSGDTIVLHEWIF